MFPYSRAVIFLGCVLAAAAASHSWAAPPVAAHASVPSVAVVGKAVELTGGGFMPGEVVTLRISTPGRRAEMAAAVAKADGTIAHSLVLATVGAYTIQLVDSQGRALPNPLRVLGSR